MKNYPQIGILVHIVSKHTNDNFFDFPKISKHFLKISEDPPKDVRRQDHRFRTFSEDCPRFLTINEGLRGRADDV